MKISVWVIMIVAFCFHEASAQKDIRRVEKLLNESLRDYDRRIIPVTSGKPLEVETRLIILNMAELKSLSSYITMEVIFHTTWIDHRLKYPGNESDSYSITADSIYMFWTPDLMIVSQKTGEMSSFTRKNIFGTIKSTGRVMTSQRFLMDIYCHMNYLLYPFDDQTCNIDIIPYAYSRNWMDLKWINYRPIWTWDEVNKSGKFQLMSHETNRWIREYDMFGDYDVLRCTLKLRRRSMNHFLRIYVPLTVIVVMSWTCFLIDYRSVPARTSMNAALVLTVIMFITSIQQTLPRTSAIRLLDIHMMVCFFYVFAGLVEYSFALSMEIRLRMQEREKHDEDSKKAETTQLTVGERLKLRMQELQDGAGSQLRHRKNIERRSESEGKKKKRISLSHKLYKMHTQHWTDYHILDRISMVLFPVSFIIYCIAYFVFVKTYRGKHHHG